MYDGLSYTGMQATLLMTLSFKNGQYAHAGDCRHGL
jgi:hypothetical protein